MFKILAIKTKVYIHFYIMQNINTQYSPCRKNKILIKVLHKQKDSNLSLNMK